MASFVERKKGVMGGVLIIRGTRLPVSSLINLLACGYQIDEIIKIYPYLDEKKISGVLEYTARKISLCK